MFSYICQINSGYYLSPLIKSSILSFFNNRSEIVKVNSSVSSLKPCKGLHNRAQDIMAYVVSGCYMPPWYALQDVKQPADCIVWQVQADQ